MPPQCPKCVEEGTPHPYSRTLQPSGTYAPYCAPHTREYQREKYRARRVLQKPQCHTASEVEAARKLLEPRQRGRRPGDNLCPRCQLDVRINGSSYCKDCTVQYRKERPERVRERELKQALDLERAKVEEAQNMYQDDNDPRLMPPPNWHPTVKVDEAPDPEWEEAFEILDQDVKSRNNQRNT